MADLFFLAPQYQLNWQSWSLAFLAAFMLGFSKAGLKGIGVVIVTIMALVFGSKASTGIILPMLILADVFAVTYYNRHARWKILLGLLPWMVLGVILGALVGKDLPESIFKRGMAIIILITVTMMWWWEQKKIKKLPDNRWFAIIMGLLAGFTTMLGNLAGAFSNIYFLALRFPKNEFIGTAAWLFFIINLFKFPFHVLMWNTITMESLALNFRLTPFVIIGFILGVRLIKIVKDQQYRKLILVLTAIGAVIIMFR